MNATKYILVIHTSGKKEIMTDAQAIKKWKELEKELSEFGYVVPTDKIYPCLYTIDYFKINGAKMKSPLTTFDREAGNFVSFVATANNTDHYFPITALLPFYERYLEAKRTKANKMQDELNALTTEIEQHEYRYDSIFRKSCGQ